MSRCYETRTKRKVRPIDDWEEALSRVAKMPPISEEFVRSEIQRQHDGSEEPVLHVKVSLKYPTTGPRINVPARSVNCKHLQCFDLATYLRERDRKLLVGDSLTECSVYWNCPICSEPAELHHLRVDGYFESILKSCADLRIVEEVEVLSNGNHRPVVLPKAEVIPVSGSPFLRGESAHSDHLEEKPEVGRIQDVDQNNDDDDAPPSVETTDLDLEGIARLPETNQLCRSVKRRLLDDFKRVQKKKKTATTQSGESKRVEAGESSASGGSDGEGPPSYESVVGERQEDNSADGMPELINESAIAAVQYLLLQKPFEKLECDMCTARFASEQAIKDHQYFFHAVAKEFECDLCVKEYFTGQELALHKDAKHGPKMILCDVCFKRFGSAQGLSDHQRAVHGISPASASVMITPAHAPVPRLPGPPTKPPPTAPKDVVDEYYRQLGIYYERLLMASTQ